MDAYVTIGTTFDKPGILAGLVTGVLLLVLPVIAWSGEPIIKGLSTHFRGWRYAHGGLGADFTALARWHSIALICHTVHATDVLVADGGNAGLFGPDAFGEGLRV